MTFNNFYSKLRKKLAAEKQIIASIFMILATATVLISAPIQVPNVFQEGDIISAEEVNANFQVLQDRINQLSDELANSRVEVLPIGTIVPFAGTSDTIPANWLLCDGKSLEKTGDYAELYGVINTYYGAEDGDHYSIPDLRGVFLRGHDPAGTKDTEAAGRTALRPDLSFYPGNHGNTIGSYQEDAYRQHDHIYRFWYVADGDADPGHGVFRYPENDGYRTNELAMSGGGVELWRMRAQTEENGHSNETRPKNVAVNYIIKFK